MSDLILSRILIIDILIQKMPIYYGLVAKRTNIILAEFTEYNGNFQQITMQLMQRIEPDTKKTFELEEFLFHYINEEGLTLLCMTDKAL